MAKQRQKMSKAKVRGIKGGWVFLGVVLLIYMVTALIDSSLAWRSILFFVKTLRQIAPVLLMVFVLMVLFNLVLNRQRIEAYLGKTSGFSGWLLAMLGGILATGPIYPWYMMLGDLKQKGMKASLVAVFLYSRAVKLPLLPLLVHYFGMAYTLILSFYLVCFSVISGVIIDWLAGRDRNYTD